MTSKRIQPWRRAVMIGQALLVLGTPFLTVGGESALRFDIPSLTLHFFGSGIAMDEFFLVLAAVLFLGFLVVFLTVLLGRIWCGWLCPQTVIIDLTRFVDRAATRGYRRLVASLVAVLVISTLLAASLIWYFVSPYEFMARLADGSLGRLIGWFWATLTAVTFLNFAFLRRIFCTTVCPYAKMQGALYDEGTLTIAADDSRMNECMHCDACLRACPVDIDIRAGLNAACVNCAECIDACARQMDRRGKRSLIGYRFGSEGRGVVLLRRGVVLAGASTAVFLGLFVYLVFSRAALDLSVSANPSLPPMTNAEGALVNAYLLSITNRSGRDVELIIAAHGEDMLLSVRPDRITLARQEHRRVPVFVMAGNHARMAEQCGTVRISVTSTGPPEVQAQVETILAPPW
jgi:cytochrome c oxidase accessory protein FixG